MRKLFFAIILFSSTANAQGGYANIGMTGVINGGLNAGITFGAGIKEKIFGVGFVADFYGLDKTKLAFATVALDLRGYFLKEKSSPYISIQPGYLLYDKTIFDIKMKGSLSFAAVAGFDLRFKPESLGINISAGYQYTSFKILKSTINDNSLKIGLTILF